MKAKIIQKLAVLMSVIVTISSTPVVAFATILDVEESIVSADAIIEEAIPADSILAETVPDEIIAPDDADDLLVTNDELVEDITNDELAVGDSVTFKFYVGEDGGYTYEPDGYWYNGLDTYTANKPTKMTKDATVKMLGVPFWTPIGKKFIGWESPDGRWRGGDVPLSALKSAKSGEDYVFTAVYKEYQIIYSTMDPDATFVMDSGRFFVIPGRLFDVWDGLDSDEKGTYNLMSEEYITSKTGKLFTGWEVVGYEKVEDVSEIDFEAHYKDVMLLATFESVAVNTLTLTNLTGIDQASVDALKALGFTISGDTATMTFTKATEKFYLPAICKDGQDFRGWYETGKDPGTASLSVEFDPTIGRDISYTASLEEAVNVDLRDSLMLYQGQKAKLAVTVTPAGTSQSVNWTSSNAGVASLTGNVVKAENEGTAFVTATSVADPSKSATCKVTVLKSDVTETDDPGDYAIDEDTGEMNIWIAGLDKTGYYYTGLGIKPQIHVYDGGKLLRESVDYTLSYKNNIKVSDRAQININMKGQYSGKEVVYFTILPTPVEELAAKDATLVAHYNKKKNQLKPVLTYQGSDLKCGKNDLTFKWFETDGSGLATDVESSCIDPGLYAVKVYAGKSGNFTSSEEGYQIATVNIYGNIAMSNVRIKGFKTKLPYDNGAVVEQPAVSLSYKSRALVLDEDYTVTYQNNRDLGTATVTYEAVKDADGYYSGDFAGKVVKTYSITGKYVLDADNTEVTLAEDSYKFTNSAIKPDVTVKARIINNAGEEETRTLVQGKDYTIAYKNNKAVADKNATGKRGKDIAPQVIVKGKGNYAFANTADMKGGVVKRFTITKADLSSLALTIADKPYSNKPNAYKATKIVFTDGNYKDLRLSNKDYTVEYTTSDGTDTPAAGQTVDIVITANDTSSYTGSVVGSYRITGPMYTDISKAKAVINPNNKGKTTPCAYTGEEVRPGQSGQPSLVLTTSGKNAKQLKQGTDYEIVSYYNNIVPSNKAVVVVRGIGSWRGIRVINFTISAKPVSSHWGGIWGW